MAGSTIGTHVSHTVTLGSAGYPSPLTVTASGYIAPTAYGADGVYADLGSTTDARLINHGTILGADGGQGLAAGASDSAGVRLEGNVLTVDNAGTIGGGNGGGMAGGTDTGGAGVWLQGATVDLVNSGVITGGDGYYGYRGPYNHGVGGAGVSLQGNVGFLHNSGTITGGDGGYDMAGGVGVSLAGDVALVNRGAITGGRGFGTEGSGGAGLTASADGTLTNFGSIVGGKGGGGIYSGGIGGVGLSLSAGATVINHGSIAGGQGGENYYVGPGTVGGSGNTGVNLAFGTLINDGTITGGAGGNGDYQGGGGTGVYLEYSTLTNAGTIAGGDSSDGVRCVGSVSILNTGLIVGGATNFTEFNIYAAGAGVFCQGSLALINSGIIRGGAYGGTGVYFGSGTLTNTGTIAGGAGYGYGYGGVSSGVFLGGGTLINAGTIAAGTYNGGAADAVLFGSAAGTLIVDPGAVFLGDVVANMAVNDVLELAGTSAATLTGLGTQFTGFATLIEAAGANWTLAGTSSFGGTASIGGELVIESGVVLAASGASGAVELSATGTAASVSNAGVILGGVGTAALDGDTGGAAVLLVGGASFTNTGILLGGTGGQGMVGGAGGMGATLLGGVLINSGVVIGGAGGAGSQTGGNGGAGVYLNGGTLTNAGTIAAGAGGSGLAGNGSAGDAVLFGSAAGTLIVDPGAVFIGDVVANAAARDVLELAGTASATLSGLGSQFTGFGTVLLDSGAIWTIDSTIATVQATTFRGVTAQDMLDLSGGGALSAANIGFGTLRLDGAPTFTLSAGDKITADVTVDNGATLDGAGTITMNVIDQGSIVASSGTLLLKGVLSGSGVLDAAAGAVLDVAGHGSSFAGSIGGAGTLLISNLLTLEQGAQLAAATVDLADALKLGAGENLINEAGNRFVMTGNLSYAVTLSGAPGTSFTNNGSLATSGSGLERIVTRFVNAGDVSANGGTLSFLGPVSNGGTIDAASGLVSVMAPVTGNGTLEIGSGAALSLDGVASGQAIDFLAAGGLLDLNMPLGVQGTIAGFGGSDRIDLIDTAATGATFAHGILSVDDGSAVVARLHFAGNYAWGDFQIAGDGNHGTMITFR